MTNKKIKNFWKIISFILISLGTVFLSMLVFLLAAKLPSILAPSSEGNFSFIGAIFALIISTFYLGILGLGFLIVGIIIYLLAKRKIKKN